MIRNTRSGEAVVFRVRVSNENLGRLTELMGGHPSERQIVRWTEGVVNQVIERSHARKFVIHSRATEQS